MRWYEFESACPELAGVVRRRFEHQQIFLLGTLRPDGMPRVSGVECDFVESDLMSGMIWHSAKALDLLRDDRMTIHSLVPDKAHESENEGDLKLYGRAIEVTEPDRKHDYEDAIDKRIHWRPPEPYHCFAYDIDQASLVQFGEGGRHVWVWRAGGKLTKRIIPEFGPE
ncbi:MAG TPA: pyridoxamine 5'-phosphate oxidase family protein [Jiangellaceae bacterium]